MICVHNSNCIVPYIRVERNILNLIIREVKSSIFKSPISKLLKCQFCFHVRDGRICDSWRSNIAIHVLKIAELIYLPYSPEILKVYSNYYMFHITLEQCSVMLGAIVYNSVFTKHWVFFREIGQIDNMCV